MGRPAGWMKMLAGRSPMKSSGAPSLRRDVERAFWGRIADGFSSDDAALAVGASQAVGGRWFRVRGGMVTFMLDAVSCRCLCVEEREEIALLRAPGAGVREIAGQLDRWPSTISRELRRNAATRGGKLEYRASVAQCKAELMARRPKTAKLAATRVCASMCNSGSAVRFAGPMGSGRVRRRRRGRAAASPGARIVGGRWRGAQNRSPIG